MSLFPVSVPHRDAPAQALAAARIWIFGVWFVKLAIDPLSTVAELPPSLHDRIGPLLFLGARMDGLLDAGALVAFKSALLVILAAAAAGVLVRVTSVLAAVGLVIYVALVTGYSTFVDHTDLSLLLATFVLAASPCDEALALWPAKPAQPAGPRYGAPLFGILAVLVSTYFLAGTNRLAFGILDDAFAPETFRLRTIINAYDEPSYSWGLAEAAAHSPWWGYALVIGTVVSTIVELGAPLTLVWRRYRFAWAGFMFFFHAGTDPLFNVRFWSPTFLFLLFLEWRDWQWVFARLPLPIPRRKGFGGPEAPQA